MNNNSSSISIFICHRPIDRTKCSTTGCSNPATAACTFALKGKAEGKTCGRSLCDTCNRNGLCHPHRRLTDSRAAS